ncbi:MAG: HAD family hydrolase [Deltaproteobacteria bacterium]|jgi:HAD superfamily hydrolase (TIGR01509 family)|nr:HAD family hydrolase [Deltaproteobacteria bacterium]
MPSTLIFDLDMTLIDSLAACATGANLLADHFGLEHRTEEDVLKSISLPTNQFWISLWGRFEPAWEHFFTHQVIPNVFALTKFFPASIDILTSAKRKGYLLGLATNRINPWNDLVSLKIAQYFDTAVGASDVPRPKPEPDIILTVIRQLRVEPSKSLFIGDSLSDMKSARSAGVKALGLLQGGASAEELYRAGADLVRADLDSSRDILDC